MPDEGIFAKFARVYPKIPNELNLVLTDHGTLGQMVAENVTKYSTLSIFAQNKGLTIDDCIAFGDDINDMEVIKGSGIGVAMGNAVNQIKEIADFVTKTNEEDGVAHFLEKNLLDN